MHHFFMRVQSFVNRLQWLGRYMPSYVHAFIYLIGVKFFSKIQGKANYKKFHFSFQPHDMSAIREVLAEKEYAFLSPSLKKIPSPVILDVGAHIGLFSLWALGENQAAKIVSIEASPQTFLKTRANCDYARNLGCHWEVFHAAAWSAIGSVSFNDGGDSMGHHVNMRGGSTTIPAMPLSEMLMKVGMLYKAEYVDIMKVDIEGAEEEFIVAGEEFLPFIRQLVIELHPNKCDTQKVRAVLERNYDLVTNADCRMSRKPLLYCIRQNPQ